MTFHLSGFRLAQFQLTATARERSVLLEHKAARGSRCNVLYFSQKLMDRAKKGKAMGKTVEGLIEEARQLPLSQQLVLIEQLARSIHLDIEERRILREELSPWDDLSDEALANFEKGL